MVVMALPNVIVSELPKAPPVLVQPVVPEMLPPTMKFIASRRMHTLALLVSPPSFTTMVAA